MSIAVSAQTTHFPTPEASTFQGPIKSTSGSDYVISVSLRGGFFHNVVLSYYFPYSNQSIE